MSERVRLGLRHTVQNISSELEHEPVVVEVRVSQINAQCSMRAPQDIDTTPTIVDLLSACFELLMDEPSYSGPATRGVRTGRETRRLFYQMYEACRRGSNKELLWRIVEVRCFGVPVDLTTTSFKSMKAACALPEPALWVGINTTSSIPGTILGRALAMSFEGNSSTHSSSSAGLAGDGGASKKGGIVGAIIHRAFEAFRAEDPSASAEAQAMEANIPLTPTKAPSMVVGGSGGGMRTQQGIVEGVIRAAVLGTAATSSATTIVGGGEDRMHVSSSSCPSRPGRLAAFLTVPPTLGIKRERTDEDTTKPATSTQSALTQFEAGGTIGSLIGATMRAYPGSNDPSRLLSKYAAPPRPVCLNTALIPFVVGSTSHFRPNAPQQENYSWSVFLRGVNNVCISSVVENVVFVLHPSFPHATQVISKPPYMITEKGWGEFEVAIYLELKHVHAPVFLTKVTPSAASSSSAAIRSPTSTVEAPTGGTASAPFPSVNTPVRHKVHIKTGHALQFSHRNCLLMRTLTHGDGVEDKRLELVRGAIGSANAERLHSRMAVLPSAEEVTAGFEALEAIRGTGAAAIPPANKPGAPSPLVNMLKDPGFVHYRHCVPPFGIPLIGDVAGFTPFAHLDPPCVYEQRDELVIVNPSAALLVGCGAYLDEVASREGGSSHQILGSSLSGPVWATILQYSPLLSSWRAGVTLPVTAKAAQIAAYQQAYLTHANDGKGLGEVAIIRGQERHDATLLEGLRQGLQGEVGRLRAK